MTTTQHPKIGIVSGAGPLAGSDVLAKLLKNAADLYGAVEDNEYPDVVLLSHGIAGVDNTAALSDAFETGIIDMVHQLEVAGATTIGIACNTAHVYLPKIQTRPATTLINLIDEVSSVAQQQNQQYLLLTSSAAKQQKLYPPYLDAKSVKYSEVTAEHQLILDQAIERVMAHDLAHAGSLLQGVLATARQAGFTAILAGCTELPIALAHCHDTLGLRIIDSNEILAQALLRHYYAQK